LNATARNTIKIGDRVHQRVLKRPEVAQAIAQRRAVLARKHELRTEDVIAQLAAIVHVDAREAFDEAGRLKAPKDWPDSLARAVAAVDVVEMATAEGAVPMFVRKLRLWDKNSAIQSAMKHLGLFAEDNAQQAAARAAAEPLTGFEAGRAICWAVADALDHARNEAAAALQLALPAPPAELPGPETLQ
jgi:sulfur relay (sulfurtransferase) DsrC/TusE family protein